MEVKRSAALFCPDAQSNGVPQRQQINAITSFIDASNVYGSSDSTQKALRRQNDKTFLLKTAVDRNQFNEERIPEVPEDAEDLADSCTPTEPNQKCAFAGDLRVNEVPTLTTIHFLFVLEHNRIAEELKDYYDDDETVFQETRRLLIAIMQKIVYDEFLPAIFSKKGLQKYKLRSTVKYQYEPETNPSLINSFGIAYRVGHSWIPQQMKLFSQDLTQNIPPDFSLDTEEVYFNPNMTYAEDGFARIAYALSGRRSPDIDNIVEEPARSRLFLDEARNIAFDLCALNIQRGRDHGLPSYNKYREFCNLKTVDEKWDEDDYGDSGLTDHTYGIRRQLKKAGYSSPRDIDLFTGGISEKSVKGGSLGPTFECLIGEQFKRLKFGDRFWYQNKDAGFKKSRDLTCFCPCL
ncbi:myeloperoxidase-like isoform X1 [Mercenaria mercenaria]|uniref:myeloperoxidase-like isoform X1 n=1 Tax=Mercenaria mercenaria TaxID=6596 RepID=UPI00234EC579|nr:myeloperoxidase-like isoform X1 [Mercenaria mercenaria]